MANAAARAALAKSAQLPLQAWLPDAMEAPTPVSAYLPAASMVKVGVYIFARAIIDGGNIPHVIGGVGMVMARPHQQGLFGPTAGGMPSLW